MTSTNYPGFLRALLTQVLSLAGTLAIVGVAVVAVVIGADFLSQRAAAQSAPTEAGMTPVAVKAVQFEDGYDLKRRFTGQIEAQSEATLSFEGGGRLVELTVVEGEKIKQGQLIARLDTALLEAEQMRLESSRDATAAQLQFAETRLARANELSDDGFASLEMNDQALATRDELQSRIAEVDAALASVEINLQKSVITAPFDGQVTATHAELSEILAPGQSVLTLVKTTAPQLRVGLPLELPIDDLTQAQVEIAGRHYSAMLAQVRPDVDPTTRTRTVLFAIDSARQPVFGQSATLALATRVPMRGAWVPISALQEGSGSIWTVLVVDDGIARAAAVELLHIENDQAYVRGSFSEGDLLIRSGAHRVVPGQRVIILPNAG